MIAENERKAIREAFGKAAAHYDGAAQVQREIAGSLLDFCAGDTPTRILDAGCGTGHGRKLLGDMHPDASIVGLDAAHAMCASHASDAICGDIERLPFAAGSFDFYWSSLAWQWTDAARSISEAARVLAPGGALRVATLGPATLGELRDAFASIDSARHVREFADATCYAPLLEAAGFTQVRVALRTHLVHASDLSALLRSIRDIGAHTLGPQRRRSLLGKHAWQRLCAAYEIRRDSRGLPATYDAIYLLATKA
jgi:malonyl-CoA O-methyltransferase